MIRFLLTIACVASVTFLFADDEKKTTKLVKIVHVKTGKVLSIESNSEDGGAQAMLTKDGDDDILKWTITNDGNYFKISNKKSGLVLDVNEVSTEEGAKIILWDNKDEDNSNQRWMWDGKGDERRLKSKSSNLVIVPDSEDKAIQKKAVDDAKEQLWKFVEVKK